MPYKYYQILTMIVVYDYDCDYGWYRIFLCFGFEPLFKRRHINAHSRTQTNIIYQFIGFSISFVNTTVNGPLSNWMLVIQA